MDDVFDRLTGTKIRSEGSLRSTLKASLARCSFRISVFRSSCFHPRSCCCRRTLATSSDP